MKTLVLLILSPWIFLELLFAAICISTGLIVIGILSLNSQSIEAVSMADLKNFRAEGNTSFVKPYLIGTVFYAIIFAFLILVIEFF